MKPTRRRPEGILPLEKGKPPDRAAVGRRGEGELAGRKPAAPLSISLERVLERSFLSAGLARTWWKAFAKELKHCRKCGGDLRWLHVEAEGRNRFVCVDCRLISYQNPKLVAATLPERDGKIYLLRRAIEPAHGLWSHPAGFMELAETVEQAAIRETREEICARVRLFGPPCVYSYKDAAVVTIVYRAEVVGPEPKPGAESLEVRAFHPHEIPWKHLAFRSTFHALRDWARDSH